MATDVMSIDLVLQAIGIIVGLTSVVIVGTCGLVVWWIRSIRSDLKELAGKFEKFVEIYYEKHEETMKKDDCIAKHAVIDRKVDRLHERVDAMEMDRR